MSEKIISEEILEKVVGGGLLDPIPTGEKFLYDGYMCKVISNPPSQLANYTWCCRLDSNGNATGVIIQVPNDMIP